MVFGDIGTSPLYAMKAVFALDGGLVEPTPDNVMGVVSMIFWAITLVVSVKYVGFILRADNDGEGGVMALAHLAQRSVPQGGRWFAAVGLLGVIGGSLFFGDSLITPAISVLSAVEGLEIAAPGTGSLIVPLAVAIIVALFAVQRFGTHRIGQFFGPIMVLWFGVIGLLGLLHVARDPAVLVALSPHHAAAFVVGHPMIAFVAMAAVVLVITGAEALYADMGHFGRVPIVWAWFALVFPALTLNYLGQAQLVIDDRSMATSPFFQLAPSWALLPLVVLATLATIIASQAVISGAYSIARQAERLGYLPRLTVRQTNEENSGQIYIGRVNWLLMLGVLVLLVTFRESNRLAVAYGVAVTAMLVLTTVLFCVYALHVRGWRWWQVACFAVVFGSVEVAFFAANIAKVLHGGWLPLLVAAGLATVMTTWHRGRALVTQRREEVEGPLLEFLKTTENDPALLRTPGTAVFLHHNRETVPLALRENARFNHVLPDDAIIVNVESANVPHVPDAERARRETVCEGFDHITYVTLRYGFSDHPDIPAGLAAARDYTDLDINVDDLTYVLSRMTVHPSGRPGMSQTRKKLFAWLAHGAADPTHYFSLPVKRTVMIGAQIDY